MAKQSSGIRNPRSRARYYLPLGLVLVIAGLLSTVGLDSVQSIGGARDVQVPSSQGVPPLLSSLRVDAIEPKSDWQIYENKKCHYAIKFPSGVHRRELGKSSGNPDSSWQAMTFSLPGYSVQILCMNNPLLLDAWNYASSRPPLISDKSLVPTTVGNLPAVRFEYLDPRNDGTNTFVPTLVIYATQGSNAVEIWIVPLDSQDRVLAVPPSEGTTRSADVFRDATRSVEAYELLQDVLGTLTREN